MPEPHTKHDLTLRDQSGYDWLAVTRGDSGELQTSFAISSTVRQTVRNMVDSLTWPEHLIGSYRNRAFGDVVSLRALSRSSSSVFRNVGAYLRYQRIALA